MPELPEVETVRRLLEPFLVKQTITKIILNRPNLRFPFPSVFNRQLDNRDIAINAIERHGKYMFWHLSNNHTIIQEFRFKKK